MNVDRPYTVELSAEEVGALVKHHCSCVRRISSRYGKISLEHRAKNILPSSRYLKELHDEAQKLSDAHISRAKGLNSILQK